MVTFYDEWLRYWDDAQEERAKARKVIHEEELEWVRTKHDYRAALLCSRQNEFITSGSVMLGGIPPGYHTGKHSHGEEGIFVIDGEGYSIIDGKRYDWDTRSCLFIPFGAVHQHFNSGARPVRYLSTQALELERFAGLARVIQYEEAGETPMGGLEGVEPAESDFHPEHGRIVLRAKDAQGASGQEAVIHLAEAKDEFNATRAKEMKTPGRPNHRGRVVYLMAASGQNGFKSREVSITGILCDEAGHYSGKHSHMEAILYVLQGSGYSIVDGERIEWKKGTLFHIQGPQTVHQHFNTGEEESQHLRIHFGLRSHFFQAIAKRSYPYLYYGYSSYGSLDE